MNPNYDQFYNSSNSLLNNPVRQSGVLFDAQYQVQATRVRLTNLIGISGTSVSNAGTVANGQAATFTTQLTPRQKNNSNNRNMAIPYVAIYEGTGPVGGTHFGSTQLFPVLGSGETPDKVRFASGFDWHLWSQGSTQTSLYKVTIYNNSGSSIIIYGVSQWQYVMNNGGISGQ